MSVIKLFIIDENSGVRRALAGRLGSSARLAISGTAGDLADGMLGAKDTEADVILVDAKTFRAPDAARQLQLMRTRSGGWAPQVIVLTAFADEVERKAAMDAGAGRYLLKDIDSQALIREIETLDAVARGA